MESLNVFIRKECHTLIWSQALRFIAKGETPELS